VATSREEVRAPINRAALVAAVADQAGLTARQATAAVDALLGSIQAALQDGSEVRLTGFGTFAVSRRKASIGRNPRTGAPIDIPPSISVKFRPGRTLREAVGADD